MKRAGPRFRSDCPSFARIAALAGLLAAGLLLGADPSPAQVLWGSTSKGGTNPSSVFTIDRTTGFATFVGASGLGDGISALRFDPQSRVLYGLFGSACTGARLITIDTDTGAGTLVGPLIGDGFDGSTGVSCGGGSDALAFAPDGTLYSEGYTLGSTRLLKVDKSSGAVLESHPMLDHVSGMAFDASGVLWVCHGNGLSTAMLHTVDPATGAYTSVRTLSEYVVISDLAFADGTLYASLPSENILATVDTATGLVTRIGSFGPAAGKISGLAISIPPPTPTPTPTSTPTPTPTSTPTSTPTPTPTPTLPPTSTPTPTAVPIPTPARSGLTSLGPARLWIGLKSSNDSGSAFDLRVELLRNGETAASGMVRCITGLVRSASAVVVPFDSFPPFSTSPGDVLSFRVSNRMGTGPDGERCNVSGESHTNAVGLRLYYDSADHGSRFEATISPGAEQDYFLHSDGSLCSNPVLPSAGVTARFFDGSAPAAANDRCAASVSGNAGGANAWKEIGTWTRIVP